MANFKLISNYNPQGDQPQAINEITKGFLNGQKFQTLLGVTGSGKTFTMANIITNLGKPTLILSHNKTLAAQLFGEFKNLFPHNAVEFFISYYDYYQPEAYVATTDTYIEKDTSINDEIDRLRLKTTSSLLERDDVIVVASVSCIYGLGAPEDYKNMLLILRKGQIIERNKILKKLVDIYYNRNDFEFARGTFRVKGDVIEIIPAYEQEAVRIELFGDEIETISIIDTLTGEIKQERDTAAIYPAKHYVTTPTRIKEAITAIKSELSKRLAYLHSNNKLLEAQRLEMRTNHDIEMMQEIGHCSGIENYSRHLTGRNPGDKPYTLLDFFPDDYIMFIDESHVALPQVRGMYFGDRARKETLVEHGFRLPSALDNRPLNFEEFQDSLNQTLFASATPADYELEKCNGVVVEQIIRPTGLIDPDIEIKPTKGQIDDLIDQIREQVKRQERTLALTLTKNMSEDLTDYLTEMGIKGRYLHSEIATLDRVEILRELRLAEFDVLVGINLLREGLDLPEVSLVAILDADKEGFLRSEVALMQIAGRAARNVGGRVIFYADKITKSMKKTIDETKRRQKIQREYNDKHGLTPTTIYKSIEDVMLSTTIADEKAEGWGQKKQNKLEQYNLEKLSALQKNELIYELEQAMQIAAKNLEFEKAAELRDEIEILKSQVRRSK